MRVKPESTSWYWKTWRCHSLRKAQSWQVPAASSWRQADQSVIVFAPGKMLPAQVPAWVKQRDYCIGFRITSLSADAFCDCYNPQEQARSYPDPSCRPLLFWQDVFR